MVENISNTMRDSSCDGVSSMCIEEQAIQTLTLYGNVFLSYQRS